jgi:hypothetical protein
MDTSATPPKKYAWLVTFLFYNNKAIDDMHIGEPDFISLDRQKNTLFNAIHDLKFSEKVKIVLVEARLNFKEEAVVWAVSKVDTPKRFKSERLTPPPVPGTGAPVPGSLARSILTDESHLTTVLSQIKNESGAVPFSALIYLLENKIRMIPPFPLS